MNKTQLITKLVRGTIHRAITESVPAVFLIFWVGNYLHKAPIASSRYYGCLLILASLGFIIGVVWSYALGYRLLHLHPESDSSFWREAFMVQAHLLRAVPLWYLTPSLTGCLLFCLPTQPGETVDFLLNLAFFGLVFSAITWLNRHAASKLEEQSLVFS